MKPLEIIPVTEYNFPDVVRIEEESIITSDESTNFEQADIATKQDYEDLNTTPAVPTPEQEAEFNVAYKENMRLVFSIVLKHIRDYQLAEELTQEVFTKAWQHWNSFSDMGKGRTPWLARIAQNTAISRLRLSVTRKEVPWDTTSEREGIFAAGTPIVGLNYGPSAESEALSDVRFGLLELLERIIDHQGQTEAVIATYINGIPFEEYARDAGIPLGTVQSGTKRARDKIVRYLGLDPSEVKAGHDKRTLAALLRAAIVAE